MNGNSDEEKVEAQPDEWTDLQHEGELKMELQFCPVMLWTGHTEN